MSSSIFTKETARRLDKVKKIEKVTNESPDLVKGKRPSQRVIEELGMRESGWPRYKPVYEAIQEMFPEFNWETFAKDDGNGLLKHGVMFENHPCPSVSLTEMLFEAYRRYCIQQEGRMPFKPRIELNKFSPNIQKRVKPLLRDEHGSEFAQCLIDIGIAYPPLQIMEKIADWYYRALEGEESTVVTPLCPDYETVETEDPSRPVVYTFNGLGSDVGFVAQRALHFIPQLWSFFKEKGIKINFVAPIGDFEATEETCQRMGVSKEEFISRLRKSQEAFRSNLNGVPLQAPLVTEIDPQLWEVAMREAREAVERGDYGALKLSEADIERIAQSRMSLYRRWYGDGACCTEILKRQAPEYMAMGKMSEKFPNPFIFGADHMVMYPFVHMERILPALCLRNANY